MKKWLFLWIAFATVGCSNDDGIDLPDNPNPNPDADVVVQDFMWQAMNLWYFWQADVPNLADDAFTTDEEYTHFSLRKATPPIFSRISCGFQEIASAFTVTTIRI